MPLARGTAVVGGMFLQAVFLAAAMPITASIPEVPPPTPQQPLCRSGVGCTVWAIANLLFQAACGGAPCSSALCSRGAAAEPFVRPVLAVAASTTGDHAWCSQR